MNRFEVCSKSSMIMIYYFVLRYSKMKKKKKKKFGLALECTLGFQINLKYE